jgi:hypothetical protein
MNKVIFGSFWIGTRLPDHFDEFLKLKRWLSVRELRYSRCIDGLLWDLRLILGPRFGGATRATIVRPHPCIENMKFISFAYLGCLPELTSTASLTQRLHYQVFAAEDLSPIEKVVSPGFHHSKA